MGLDINALRFLLDARASGTSFDTTITLGRQGLFVEPAALRGLPLRPSAPLTVPESEALLSEADGFCEPFLRMIGAREVRALDVSDYQSASIVHDMNEPLPQSLHQSCTALVDSGTLEHIFNFPQAIKNCMQMVRIGGHFICVTTANNFMGHGFYQFSPELFFRVFSAQNGFALERMVIYEEYWSDIRFYDVSDPQVIGRRVTLSNRYPTYLLCRARRVAGVPVLAATPQQSDYIPLWECFGDGRRAADAGRSTRSEPRGAFAARALWRALKPLVPPPLKRRLQASRRGADPFDPQMYKRATL